jgi:methylamine dehydrogenase accessory protein MauD
MSGAWLASYVVLWGIVLFQGLVIFVLMRQLGIIYLGTAQGVGRDGIPAGQRAPDFTLPDLAGSLRSLADFRGRLLLLVFGSTSCAPCRGLVPDLNAFAQAHAAELDALFAIRGTPNETQRFVEELGIEVPIGIYNDEELPEKYKARVTPFAFVIDGEGIVRSKGLANNRAHLDMLLKAANDELKSHRGAKRNGVAIVDASLAEETRR